MTKPSTSYDLKNNTTRKMIVKPLQQQQPNRASVQSTHSGRVVVTQISNDVWSYENDWFDLSLNFSELC
jgi:hypothetical protein